jgi:DNA-binding SARP family transcriptional activator
LQPEPWEHLDTSEARRDAGPVQAVLRMLGPVELVGPDGVVPLGGPKERCLLAVLAVHLGEVVVEDRLVDALWNEAPPRTAAKTMQNYVMRVRRRLDGLGGAAILTRSPGYVLDGSMTDVRLVEQLIAEGRRAAGRGDHDTAIARFEEALGCWRGPSIAEFADRSWARTEAARLDELRESVAEERMAGVLAAGRHHEAIAECEKLVAEQPLRERRWTQLMLALYRDGRQGEALEAYRRLRAVLAAQLGVDPGPEARRLEAAILGHDVALLSRPPRPPPARAATPCVGRDRELAALLAHLADVEAGRGRVTFLAGEAGIGKSRLLAELAEHAAGRGAQVLAGRCLEGSGALPFHPFVEAIETFLDGRAPPPGAVEQLLHVHDTLPGPTLQPDELRLRLLDGVARFLVRRTRAAPVVLLVDDLHWADDGTVAMVRHVARSTPGRRLLVVGAYRDGEVTAGHPLEDALGALRSEAECGAVRLAGLARSSVAQLLDTTVGAPVAAELLDAVCAETHGNPFFVREVARHLVEDGGLHPEPDGRLRTALPLSVVPEGVRQVIGRRRRRLTAVANRFLDVAAAVEGPFLYEPVRAAAALSDAEGLAALDDALHAGLVVPDVAPERYDFTHALIRHTVYHGLNPSRRLRVHRDLAAAADAVRGAGARISAAEVATQYHRSAALPGAEAGVPAALEAAERARAAGAHGEQATFLQMAIDLLPPGDGRGADLLGRRGVALAWALRFDDAVAAAQAAAAAGSGVAVMAEVATVLSTAGSNTHAWQLAAIAVDATAGPDGEDAQAWAALTLLDLDRREAADPDHPGMQLDLPGRRTALRILHESGRLTRRGDLARYAVAAIHGGRDRIPTSAAADPTVAAYLCGDYAAAVPLFARAADEAETHGQLAWAVYCRSGQARCQTALGELEHAAELLAHTRQLVARLPGLALGWQLLHHQGAEDALAMALDEGWPQRMAGFAPWMAPGPERHWGSAGIAGVGARAQARMGRTDAALALLARPIRALRTAPAWAPNYTRIACEVAETLWLLNRRDHLAIVESALREKALPADFRFPMTDARQALARLCALDGRPAEAHRWFDEARAVLDAQGARPLRAVVDHDEAVMHLRMGDRIAAAPYLAGAAAAFDRLGMTGWARRLARAAYRA